MAAALATPGPGSRAPRAPSSTPGAAATPPAVVPDRQAARAERQMLHGPAIASHVYARQMRAVAGDDELQATAFGHAADVLRRLDCRDPLEEMLAMLAMQAVWAHARAARLSMLANTQDARNNMQVVNAACDRASDTFRRLMLALAEYRRPPRPAHVRVTAYGQANVAQQQVVQQVAAPEATNGQG